MEGITIEQITMYDENIYWSVQFILLEAKDEMEQKL